MFIGILSGFFGVGGGFILTPTLLLLGYDPIQAIIVSLLYTIGTSLSGVFAHFRLKNIIWKDALIIASSGIIATQIAYPFIMYVKERNVDELIIPFLYILLLLYFSYKMLWNKRETVQNVATKRNLFIPKNLIVSLTGFTGGFLSVILGVGGGFIIVPLLVSYVSYQTKSAVGTSLMGVLFIVVAGFLSFIPTTPIDYQMGGTLVIGGLIGAQLGAFISTYYDHLKVKRLLGFLYVITCISMILKLIQLNVFGLIVLACFLLLLYVHMMRHFYIFKKEIRSESIE